MKFSTKLTHHIDRMGLSQKKVGIRIGYSQSLISKWVNEKAVPDYRQVLGVARAMGLDIEYLADDEADLMDEEAIEADRKVRDVVGRLGPRRTWEILVAYMEGRPAQIDPGAAKVGVPVITNKIPDDPRRVVRPEGPPPSVPGRRRKSGGD